MDFFLLSSVLLFFFWSVFAQDQDSKPFSERSVNSSSLWTPLKHKILRLKRSTSHKITGENENYTLQPPKKFLEIEESSLIFASFIPITIANFTFPPSWMSVTYFQLEDFLFIHNAFGKDEIYEAFGRNNSECLFATSEDTFYYYKAEESSDEVCGVYLFTEPDRIIEVHFDYLNVPCETGGLVTFFDGWELNGKFFPGINDHEKHFRQRYKEFCGTEKSKKTFVTTQNAGMLHYKIPEKGKGFSFYVKFLKNPAPCNILVESKEDFYTLRNHGKANNCTLIAVFPAKIKVLALDVGNIPPAVETGLIYQCGRKKIGDRLQIGGSEDLDSSSFELFEDFCGLQSSPGVDLVVGCEVTVVRLLSSGLHDNSATFSIGQPEENELFQTEYNCKL